MNVRAQGFTLIELMIVVAIIAILATIAYPSYQGQLAKSRRAEGKALLLEVAQALEKCKTLYGVYGNGSGNCNAETAVEGAGIPSAEGFYTVTGSATAPTVTPPAPTKFTLTATLNSPFTDPACGNLTLDQAGVKGKSGTGTVDDCW